MDKYEAVYIGNKPERAFNKGNRAFKRRGFSRRSSGGQRGCVVRTVCFGCGRTLGRYENLRGLAWCYNCRRILFPDTVKRKYVPLSRILPPRIP